MLKTFITILSVVSISTCSWVHNDITIGVLIPNRSPIEAFIYKQAIHLALHENQPDTANVTLQVKDTSACDSTEVAGVTSDLLHQPKVTTIIGPSCSAGCTTALQLTTYSKKLLISYRCSEVEASTRYPYFARTRPFARGDSQQITKILKLMAKNFNWKIMGIVFSTEDSWTALKNEVAKQLEEKGITVKKFPIQAYSSPQELLRDIKYNARILLMFTSMENTAYILQFALQEGVHASHEYAVFTVDFDSFIAEDYIKDANERARVFEGVINMRARLVEDFHFPQYVTFASQINNSVHAHFTESEMNHHRDHINTYMENAAYLYDALLVYLAGIDEQVARQYTQHFTNYLEINNFTKFFKLNNLTLDTFLQLDESSRDNWVYPVEYVRINGSMVPLKKTNHTFPILNQTDINNTFVISSAVGEVASMFQTVLHTSIHGKSGPIKFHPVNGNRHPTLIMTNIKINGTVTLHKGNWSDDISFSRMNITWLGGSSTAPPDTPKCGFGTECVDEDNAIVLIVCLCIVAFILLVIIAYKIVQMQKYENDVNSKESILKFSDIKTNVLLNVNSTTEEIIEKKGIFNPVTGTKKIQAIYSNKPVMLKKLPKKDVIMTRQIMIELKQLRDLKHPNINGIIGVTSRTPNITVIQEYCKKGSLYDILNNEDIQLDWVFKHTFLWDIINGMCAIHDSPIKLHGNLTSKNCLITHRWIVQIADFGLKEYKRNNAAIKTDPEYDQHKYEALLWTAPENINFPKKESRSGDVYSFAILISEIINRQPPFSAFDDMRPSDVIHYIRKRCIPPFRPHVTLQTGLDARLLDVMKNCWSEWAEDRPTFKEIKPIIKQIRGEGVEIIDNMIDMMERYSRDLDKTARERTEMFKKEKIKSNELLYRCVPKPIVQRILDGDTIEPYHIPLLTLCVIKIANLKKLEEMLPPEKLVDVINDYYKMGNNLLEIYERIYTLSTDRDEIIYCSHMPEENTNVPPLEMAQFAINFIKSRARIRWRHIDVEDIKLKVLLHSGPATGVVVGNKIPVYTLHGDTLENARTMVRYTPGEKIVATAECYELIKYEDDLIFEEVGLVKCKGVGVIAPHYITESKTIGVAFTVIPEEIPEEEVINPEETERSDEGDEEPTERDYEPPVREYWDVSSVIETAYEQWFQAHKQGKVVEYNIPPEIANPK